MNKIFFENVRRALKSKEYWFGFLIIITSCVITSIYNLSPTGIFSGKKIGGSEFFISAIMYSNTLLYMSAPVLAIFVCVNQNSIFLKSREQINLIWGKNEIKAHFLTNITIGSSVFILSYLVIYLAGLIIYSFSTGSMQPQIGLFKQIYESSPPGYVFLFILYSGICGALYSLFGTSLKIALYKSVNYVMFITLVFYTCFDRLGLLFPFGNLLYFISPFYTFQITTYDISLLKRCVGIAFILVLSVILIIISRSKGRKAMT